VNKAELLNTLKTARAEWDAVVEEALKAEANGHTPYAEGKYTLKDVIAHVTWYERETASMLKARALVGSEHWKKPDVDSRNEAVYGDIKDLPLDTVLKQKQEVYKELVTVVDDLAGEDIEDASRFNGLPWPPSRVVAGNAYEHYQQHIPSIRAWLEG
jgi:hypothetical protein